MNHVKSLIAVFLVALLSATGASASCPSVYGYNIGGYGSYYVFYVDSSCMTSSSVTPTTLSGCGDSAYEFGTGYSQYIQWSFVVPAEGATINNGTFHQLSTNYSVKLFIDFSSPTQTFYDNIMGTVTVTHNGVDTGTTFLSLYGNSAPGETCHEHDGNFTATNGDTITIRINVTKWGSGSVIKTGLPVVFNLH